jgi:hypothetical protein
LQWPSTTHTNALGHVTLAQRSLHAEAGTVPVVVVAQPVQQKTAASPTTASAHLTNDMARTVAPPPRTCQCRRAQR